jgi:very-short-patch-repair endonuclease
VDFYAPAASLIVELDGAVHDTQSERDALRQSYLERGGFRVLRFTNEEVLTQIERVKAIIVAAATSR